MAVPPATPELPRRPQVPAFSREVKTACTSTNAKNHSDVSLCHREADAIPETLDALKRCIVSKECHIFDRYNHDGHGTTDYRAWLKGFDRGRPLKDVACFISNRYEPYVVLRKTPWLPRYDERFTGYGKNKIQNARRPRRDRPPATAPPRRTTRDRVGRRGARPRPRDRPPATAPPRRTARDRSSASAARGIANPYRSCTCATRAGRSRCWENRS